MADGKSKSDILRRTVALLVVLVVDAAEWIWGGDVDVAEWWQRDGTMVVNAPTDGADGMVDAAKAAMSRTMQTFMVSGIFFVSSLLMEVAGL